MNTNFNDPMKQNDSTFIEKTNTTMPNKGYKKEALMASLFGAGGLMGFVSTKAFAPSSGIPSETEDSVLGKTDADPSLSIPKEKLSEFELLFKEARASQGPGGLFTYNDKPYNTYYKEEWDALSTQEKNAYFTKIAPRLEMDQNGKVALTEEIEHQQKIEGDVINEFSYSNNVDVKEIDEDNDGVGDYIIVNKSSNSSSDESYIERIVPEIQETDASSPENPYLNPDSTPTTDQNVDFDLEMGEPNDAYLISPEQFEVLPTDALEENYVDPSTIEISDTPVESAEILGIEDIEIMSSDEVIVTIEDNVTIEDEITIEADDVNQIVGFNDLTEEIDNSLDQDLLADHIG